MWNWCLLADPREMTRNTSLKSRQKLREHDLQHQVEIHEEFEEQGLREYF